MAWACTSRPPPSGSSGSRRRCRSASRCGATTRAPYEGKHYHLERTLNSPQPLRTPPILIGGGGEQKTLRLVARYAQACNLFPSPELGHKLDVLRKHCETEGRDYDEIEKTVMFPLDPGDGGSNVEATIASLQDLAKLGIQHVHGWVPRVWETERLALIGREIVPAAAEL